MVSEIKPVCGLERTRLAEKIPLSTPYSVYIFPTTFCNFRCVYCAHSLGIKEMKKRYHFSRETMRMETYEKAIEQLKEFPERIKMLSLTGQGEPLINKNIGRMVKMAKESSAFERVEIITNGALLTKELSDELIAGKLDTLRISLQGLSSEKYRNICGADINFDEFLDNIRYFYRNKKNTNLFIKIIDISLDNEDEEAFYRLFSDCSDRMYVEKMLPAYAGVKITEKMDVNYDRYGRGVEKRQVCPLPFFMLGILPNGDIEPCDTIYKPIILGNVHNDHIHNTWNGKLLRDFWMMQLRGEKNNNEKCAMCCAADDVAHPEDILDDNAFKILHLFEKNTI
ncbi:MAG: radical SAM protein [Candidatus Xenobiia bacterium LiM19]